MAKRNDFMEGRNEGMAFALKIAKEKGIDELEKECKMRGALNVPSQINKKALDEFVNNVKYNTVDTVVLLAAVTLHDEFDFAKPQLQQFIDRFSKKTDCLVEDYTTWEDQIQIMRDECGLDFSIRKNEKNVKSHSA